MNVFALAVVDAAIWGGLSASVGITIGRASTDRFARDTWFTRLRRFEEGGRFYESKLGIRSWKDRVPEAGGISGGFSKAAVRTGDRSHLERFVLETRRAEYVHLVLLVAAPLFLLWNPLWLGIVMVAYGIVANLPCMAIQRYNRARLLRVLGRGRLST